MANEIAGRAKREWICLGYRYTFTYRSLGFRAALTLHIRQEGGISWRRRL